MITGSQKRVVMALCLTLLSSSITPLKAHNNNAGDAALGVAIGAGIIGLCGLAAYGISQIFSGKSDEQILQEADQALRAAHPEGQRFAQDFANVFMQGGYNYPTLTDIENHFLLIVAYKAFYDYNRFSIDTYITTLANHKSALKAALDQVDSRLNELSRKNKTYEHTYGRLIDAQRALRNELSWYDQYYPKFADHRAYFALYDLESRLYEVYAREFTVGWNYMHDRYAFESLIMQEVRAKDVDRNYPLVGYYAQLNRHITKLHDLMNSLRYHYAARKPEAQRLFDYLATIREVMANNRELQKEVQRKREDDERREYLEREARAREREAAAREREAAARERDAHANMRRADAERERNYIESERNRIEREKLYRQQKEDSTTVIIIE